jgi:hypothetical protein
MIYDSIEHFRQHAVHARGAASGTVFAADFGTVLALRFWRGFGGELVS